MRQAAMGLCNCEWRPKCMYHHCREPADWSVLMPPVRFAKDFPHGRFKFFCSRCRDIYFDALSKPMKGIDRPEHAPDDWQPSIMEHVRLARIDMQLNEQAEQNRKLQK